MSYETCTLCGEPFEPVIVCDECSEQALKPDPDFWIAVNVRTAIPYGGVHQTKDAAERYIAQVHQSNDDFTLQARPLAWADR